MNKGSGDKMILLMRLSLRNIAIMPATLSAPWPPASIAKCDV